MAELILTEDEKNALTFMEWDDAALGKACKRIALIFNEKDTGGKKMDIEFISTRLATKERDEAKLTIGTCALMLIRSMLDCNALSSSIYIEAAELGPDLASGNNYSIEISEVDGKPKLPF